MTEAKRKNPGLAFAVTLEGVSGERERHSPKVGRMPLGELWATIFTAETTKRYVGGKREGSWGDKEYRADAGSDPQKVST